MDLNETLKIALSAAKKAIKQYDDNETIDSELSNILATSIIDLDNWLKSGGFIPYRWISRK